MRRVAEHVFVPFTVGGGIRDVDDMFEVLKAGAEKISVDSMAVRNPDIIREGADAFGRQCIVLSTQVKHVGIRDGIPSGYEVFIDGARLATGMDALDWVRRGEELGAGEIVVNSIDRDGTASGYDLDITRAVADAVNVPVIASGGAGTVEHIADGLTAGGASAAIISSILYSPRLDRNVGVRELKDGLGGARRADAALPRRVAGATASGALGAGCERLPVDHAGRRPRAARGRSTRGSRPGTRARSRRRSRCSTHGRVVEPLDAARAPRRRRTFSASSISSPIVRTWRVFERARRSRTPR